MGGGAVYDILVNFHISTVCVPLSGLVRFAHTYIRENSRTLELSVTINYTNPSRDFPSPPPSPRPSCESYRAVGGRRSKVVVEFRSIARSLTAEQWVADSATNSTNSAVELRVEISTRSRNLVIKRSD